MKFRFTTIGTTLALLMAGGLGLGAQDVEQTVRAGLVSPQFDMRTLTQNSLGYGFEYSIDWVPTAESGIGAGLDAGWFNCQGKNKQGSFLQPQGGPTDGNGNVDPMFVNGTCNVKATYVGADLIYAIPGSKLTVRTGPQLVSFDVTQRTPAAGNGGAMGETAFKLGWRAGLEYRFSKVCSASVMFTQAHWQNLTSDNYNSGNVFQSNPSWLTIMAGYKF